MFRSVKICRISTPAKTPTIILKSTYSRHKINGMPAPDGWALAPASGSLSSPERGKRLPASDGLFDQPIYSSDKRGNVQKWTIDEWRQWRHQEMLKRKHNQSINIDCTGITID